jgi:hypothetical protein
MSCRGRLNGLFVSAHGESREASGVSARLRWLVSGGLSTSGRA